MSQPLPPPAEDEDAARAALASAEVVLVSACLLGVACRYDGREQRSAAVLRALEGKQVVPVCPEGAGGLGIPRPPVELSGGDGGAVWRGEARALERAGGADVSEAFCRGAQAALEAAQRFGAPVALLKEKSPSCGSRCVYRAGQLVPGEGVTAALLRQAGLAVLSEAALPAEGEPG